MSLEEFKNEVEIGSRDCRKKGTTIRSKEREVIKSIIESCDQEAKQKCLLFPLRQATKRAAQYAKISERTVKRIREEVKLGIEFSDSECSSPGKRKRSKMSFKFASNLSFMFGESPTIIGRYQLAKQAGFKAVESGFPFGFTVEEVVEAKKNAGVDQILINIFTGDVTKGELGFAAIPGQEEDFKKSLELTIEYAKALECKKIHIMAGKVESPTDINDSVYESNLRIAVKRLETEGIIGLIEPINSITVPNYYLHSFDRGLDVVKKINSPNLRLMLDLFHLQHTSGNITNFIKENLQYFAHVQVAQVPSRHEVDVPGEIDFKYVFSVLEQEGYDGHIGLEYKPKTSSLEAIKWVKKFGYSL